MDQGSSGATASASDARVGGWGAGAAFAAILIAAAILLSVATFVMMRNATDAVESDHVLDIRLERLLSSMKDLETGVRGYLLTHDDAYLDPYLQAQSRLDPDLAAVHGLAFDPAPLAAAVAERRSAAEQTLTRARDGGARSAPEALGTGKAAMDRVRQLVADAQARANAQIAQTEQRVNWLLWPLALFSLLLLLAAVALIARVAAARRREQRISAMLLQNIMENAPVGLGVLDESLRVQHLNSALAAASGASGEATTGGSVWDVLPGMRAGLEPALRTVMARGRTTTVDVTVEPADPSDHPRAFQAVVFPFEAEHGSVQGAGIGLVLSDVTARRRMERRLKDSEVRFRTLTETSAAIIWGAGPDGAFDRPQPRWSAFTGQSEEETRGLGWLDAVHPDDRAATLASWTHAVATRSVYTIEHRLRAADGAWRYMASTAVPITDQDGVLREWVGTHTDITERKLAEAELSAAKEAAEASNRAKSAFLANMSHELRTPLSAVIGYSEMMEEEVEDLGEKGLLTDLGKIKSNARHLLSLINDVLDLSKIEANRMDTFLETADVATVATDVASTVDALIKQKRNTLVLDLATDLGTIRTDIVKLRQCLLNLLGNAAKFTENGTITLRVERQEVSSGTLLAFQVIDTGIGMTAEQLSRLFARFSQADESTTRKYGGTGLGLAITRAFSRLLGGDVTVASRPGEGTTFTLTLPANLAEHRPGPTEGEAHSAPSHDVSRDVVLVIDDDSAQRDLIIRFLDRQGFAARTAPDGVSGLAMARDLHPRAILLDVMMPQMDGWHVLNTLKNDPDLARIPVIMVTFTADNGLSTALGAADHVNKPVDWDQLRGVMDKLKGAKGDILVVDDDPSLRERMRVVLERNGWTMQEAENGREALVKVMHGPPRAILLDLTMPVMDGFDFLHALRANPIYADIPVIVFTARDISAGERQQLSEADRVMSKTMGLKELTGELEKLVPPREVAPADGISGPGTSA